MEPYGYIYKVTNKINGKTYIGKTTRDFDKRYMCNIGLNTKNKLLKKDIEIFGIENFDIQKKFDVAYSDDELDRLEIKYIEEFHCLETEGGYNRESGGRRGRPSEILRREQSESHKGYVMPDSQKQKISDALKGEKSPRYGKSLASETREKISSSLKEFYVTHDAPTKGRKLSSEQIEKMRAKLKGRKYSQETLNKISESLKGVPKTEEHRRNISAARKGMTFSEEHRRHLGEAKKGKTLSEEHRKKIANSLKGRKTSDLQKQRAREATSKKVLCIETGEIFESGVDAAKKVGLSSSAIYMCCKGATKTAAKMHWKYIE